MSILDRYLKKIGVESYDGLNAEEKATFKEWEQTLAGRTIRDEDYRKFLELELDNAVLRLTDVNLKKEDEVFRKVEVRLIRKILAFLDMPKIEKALIEEQLSSKL